MPHLRDHSTLPRTLTALDCWTIPCDMRRERAFVGMATCGIDDQGCILHGFIMYAMCSGFQASNQAVCVPCQRTGTGCAFQGLELIRSLWYQHPHHLLDIQSSQRLSFTRKHAMPMLITLGVYSSRANRSPWKPSRAICSSALIRET